VANPHIQDHQSSNKGKAKQSFELVLEKIVTPYSTAQEVAGITLEVEGDSVMQMEEHDLDNIDLEKPEDAFNK